MPEGDAGVVVWSNMISLLRRAIVVLLETSIRLRVGHPCMQNTAMPASDCANGFYRGGLLLATQFHRS